MFRLPALKLGRLFGIPVELNLSWFLVFCVAGWTWSVDVYPALFPGRPLWVDVTSGLVTTLLFFGSIVAHELSHSIVAGRAGIPVQRVTLFMFGGVAQLSEEPRSPRVEALMSLAGPGMSLALAGACYASFRAVVAAGATASVVSPLLMLAGVNLSVAVFNLAPGYPMDGGRVVHAFMWWATGDRRLATRLSSWVGQGLGLLMAAAGAWILTTGSLEGLWFVLLGLFLRALAAAAYASQAPRLELQAEPVGSIMTAPAPAVGSADPIGNVVRTLGEQPSGQLAAVLDPDGRLLGVVTLPGALLAMSPGDRDATAAGALAPIGRGMVVDADESVESVARRFEESGAEALLVADDGRVAGTVSRAQVGARMMRLAPVRSSAPLRWLAPRS